jgi:hypothetical protein
MNNPYLLSESEKTLIDKVFAVALVEGADLNEKWVAGIVLLSDVLLRLDEFTQARTLAGITAELRAALHGIREIQNNGVSPNDTGRLQ